MLVCNSMITCWCLHIGIYLFDLFLNCTHANFSDVHGVFVALVHENVFNINARDIFFKTLKLFVGIFGCVWFGG